ncbi:hypothetical protein [Kitasatospora sp. NPDC087315]|uniref:hypothetical protein n=1 Tax=Kitasatospora sp. NPDC087315 TaxID=3364069 RepID=UPI003819D904
MPKTTTAVPEPPADAVAADAHWTATLERLRNRKLATTPLRLWDDIGLKQAFNGIQERAAKAALMAAANPDSESHRIVADTAAAELANATVGADKVSTVLTFRALPGETFTDLVKAHPPTPEQADQAPNSEWNAETFPPALIAAANVDGITEDQAIEFLATWGHADRLALFDAALTPQTERRADLGKG